VAIAALAGATTSVRFMTAVLIAPLRHPVFLAKEAATASAMSGGRLDLGVGVGWLREEFEAVGLSTFDDRGRVTDEMLPLLRRLWTGGPVAHAGPSFEFEELTVNPKADVAIFVGGHSAPALRRAAGLGDGWVGVNPGVEELASIVATLRAATGDRPFEIRSGIKGTLTAERVGAVRAMGVDSLLLAPWQIGERRESVFDQPLDALIEALPATVERVLAAAA
jgi:alkanesulfonate monooxygenase SsuD/methylene tetrahydromethanopterin reductase-like flavin-dependent oxidoreductase (luciferase family)